MCKLTAECDVCCNEECDVPCELPEDFEDWCDEASEECCCEEPECMSLLEVMQKTLCGVMLDCLSTTEERLEAVRLALQLPQW
jgi:hypothetical protein